MSISSKNKARSESTSENPLVELIIVRYGAVEYLKQCVEQVLQVTDYPYHLTIYDNYPNDENLSVVWNRLIARTDADYICLLNPDTIPERGWLTRLMSTFDKPKIGAVGAISNTAGGFQGGHQKSVKNGQNKALTTLSGFCLLFPKRIWKEVGGFDERFHLYGEDSLFTARIKKAGYQLIARTDTFVYHYKEKSRAVAEARGKDITKERAKANKLFQEEIHKMYDGKEL